MSKKDDMAELEAATRSYRRALMTWRKVIAETYPTAPRPGETAAWADRMDEARYEVEQAQKRLATVALMAFPAEE